MRKPTELEKRFREVLLGVTRNEQGVLSEGGYGIREANQLLRETVWMKKPTDPTARLWGLAENIINHPPMTKEYCSFCGNMIFSIQDKHHDDCVITKLKQLVEEHRGKSKST